MQMQYGTDVSREDIAAYARDGAVCIRNAFDPAVIAALNAEAGRIIVGGDDVGLLPHYPARYLSRRVESFRRFVFDSRLGAIAGAVLGSKTARLFFDDIFAKKPMSAEVTPWHTDRSGWPCTGMMIPSLWIPLSPITRANSLEVIAGSQRSDVRYWNLTPNARRMIRPADHPTYPDCEPLRKDPSVRFLAWEMALGDVLFVHPWALHYSGGNPTEAWRFAYSVRVFGDDVAWDPRPECLNVAGVSFDEMIPGEKPSGPFFPLLWSEDGARDTDARYPRGFATQWTNSMPRKQQGANEYELFARTLDALGGPSKTPTL